jgi:hypothetical protein
MTSRFWRAGSNNAVSPNCNVLANVVGGLGPELVTDGGFDNAANWTADAGWSVTGSNGVASATNGFLWQPDATGGVVAGHTYRIVFTVSSYTSGSINFYLGNSVAVTGTARTAPGTYSQDVTAVDGLNFGLKGAGFTGSVDSFSVKEVF